MLLSCLHSFRAAEEWIGDRMRWNPVVECWMNCFVVFTSGVFRSVEKMLRRKPTRLELKIDDIEEFESVKKELEVQILFFLVWSVFSLINRNTTILSLIQWFFFLFQARKRQREEAESGGGGSSVISVDIISGGPSVSASSSSTASRTDLINERIGYKPHPKPATLPTLFGSLQF